MQLCGRRFDTAQPVRLEVAEGRVTRAEFPPSDAETQAWPWIAPGLFDLQVNGHSGREFVAPTLGPDDVRVVAHALLACGVTRFCPTITTESFEAVRRSLRVLDEVCRDDPAVASQIAGIHLEGPYISFEDGPRGAHPREHCRKPDWDEFVLWQRAAGGRIKLITLAPEHDDSIAFIRRAVAAGVVVCLGHTAAAGDAIRAAVDAGARLSTHLGNGCHRMLPRHVNYVWEQLADDRLLASLIVDGEHLPPAVVQSFVRAKSAGRCVLVSDLAAQAGLPPGRYAGMLCEVEVLPGGRLVIAGQTEMLAGATAPLGAGVAGVMRMAGVSLAEAIAMASHRPASLLGLPCGKFAPGDPADFVLFDLAFDAVEAADRFQVRQTVVSWAGDCPPWTPADAIEE